MNKSQALPLIKAELPNIFLTQEYANLLVNQSNFDQEFNDWICDDDKVITFRVSEKSHSVFLITNHEDGLFSLIRIFILSGKWVTSVDVSEKSVKEVFDRLLTYA